MKWIGLTGGLGCGKSTALKTFKDLGCGVVSADSLVSNLYSKNSIQKNIISLLDLNPETKSSELKNEVSKVVFKSSEKLKKLEEYLHPLVRKESLIQKNILIEENFLVSFYEIPLLFEKNLESTFDKTLCIGAVKNIQIKRIKKRNPDWSLKEIDARINAQWSLQEKKKRADFYIDNSKSLNDLKQECSNLLSIL